MGRAAADNRSRGKSYSNTQRGNAARREVQSASAAALRAARLQCEFSLGGCKGGVSLFEKEIPLPYTLPEKIPIASEQLEELQCLPIVLPCARRCRVNITRRFASAPIIRCRSAHLVGVQPNHRLSPVSTMWRAQQCHIPQAVCRRANVTRASR